MSRTTPSTILPIQRVMADANPRAWRDGIVLDSDHAGVVVAFLDGGVATLRLAGARRIVTTGDPVAHHPVAEILTVGGHTTTARAA